MNWSKEHLEARMLDALEGRLSGDQLIQLQQLLQDNPEFGDLDDSMIFVHQDETIEFDHSSLLKKESFSPAAYVTEEGPDKEKMAFAMMEGILSKQEEKDFEHLLKVDPELKQHLALAQQTKLIPNEWIQFPHMETLTKEKGKVIPFRMYFSYAAAASVILVLFLNWPSPENHVKTASKSMEKPVNVDQKETKSHVAETNKTIGNLNPRTKNIRIEHIDLRQNEARDCIVQEVFPESEQIQSEQTIILTQQITDPIELAAVNPTPEPIYTVNSSKASEPIGIREFVIQKGNEKLFGTAKPSVAEKYTSITNYLAETTKIPIIYNEKEDEKVKTTYFKLGFITIERKQTKK
ncbi:MAG: hypothetical protein RLZZ585_993 [Bacteroidota bacterium]|jgi:hypothetical protein